MTRGSALSALDSGFLLDGQFIRRGKSLEVRSPFDQHVVGATFLASPGDVETAISAAERAFSVTRKLPAYERQRVLQAVSAALWSRRDEFAHAITAEAGKPLKAARAEVERAVFTFTTAAEEATRIYGEYLPLDAQPVAAGRFGIVRRFPLGPIAGISPFNFPLNLVAHKVAPAIASGCSMVLKPASQTPFSALMLGRLVNDAGWPAGGLNVLPISNQDAAPLIEDDRLKLLTFTGSSEVGWQLKRRAGKKRVALELGGNAGVIVHSDADLTYAAERCVVGGFTYAGQSCISVQRILVHASVFEPFVELLIAGVRRLKTGDPLSEETDVGPLIRVSDAERAESWVEEAVTAGATLLHGGGRNGAVLDPVVLTGTKPDMRVNCDEVFAPVVTVEPYAQFSEAISAVNDSAFGLQSGVFTNNARLIFQAFEEIETGGVIAGDVPTFRIDQMPYGGMKDSGTGREGVRYAMEEMTERKLLVMNLR